MLHGYIFRLKMKQQPAVWFVSICKIQWKIKKMYINIHFSCVYVWEHFVYEWGDFSCARAFYMREKDRAEHIQAWSCCGHCTADPSLYECALMCTNWSTWKLYGLNFPTKSRNLEDLPTSALTYEEQCIMSEL